jgi:hypothetical protein
VRIRGSTKQQRTEEGNTDNKQTRFQKNQIPALKVLSVEHENKTYSSSPRTKWKNKLLLLLLHLTASSVDSPLSLTRGQASQQAQWAGKKKKKKKRRRRGQSEEPKVSSLYLRVLTYNRPTIIKSRHPMLGFFRFVGTKQLGYNPYC